MIPSHKGVKLNKIADEVAKDASHNQSGLNPPWIPPALDFKSIWKLEMRTDTINYIKKEGLYKGMSYCELNADITLITWFYNFCLPRRSVVSITRLIVRWDYTALQRDLARFNLVEMNQQ